MNSSKIIFYVSFYPQRKKDTLESPEICVHTARSSRVEAVAKHRRSREQSSSSTPVQIARPLSSCSFLYLLNIEPASSRLLTAHWCRQLLVHHHLRCLLVRSRLMKPRLPNYTLRSFLRPRNPSLSKASIARQHYQYM